MSENTTIKKIEVDGLEYDIEDSYARTSLDGKQAIITANGLLKGDGNGGVTAAIAGTDYLTGAYTAYATYTATLIVASWTNTTPSTYTYSNTSLKCGSSGTTSPIITCTNNITEYSAITSAVATAGTGIVFTAPTAPTSAIDIIIIDF